MVMADRRLGAILAVTIIYNVFAWPFTSMIPVIGRDRLLLGPEGVGLLASIDGVGAFAAPCCWRCGCRRAGMRVPMSAAWRSTCSR